MTIKTEDLMEDRNITTERKIVLERVSSYCRIEGNEMKNRLKFSKKDPKKTKKKNSWESERC